MTNPEFSPMQILREQQAKEPPEFAKQWLYLIEQSRIAGQNQAFYDMKAYEIESQYDEYDWQLLREMIDRTSNE